MKVLRRAGRNIELTPAGRRLAAYAAEALAADETIRTELALLRDAPSGRLRMTVVQTPAFALLPGVLDRLAGTAPDLQLEVVQLETAPALEELRSRAVDLVVGVEYEPVPVGRHHDVDRHDLLREDVLVVLHPDHPAARRRAASVRLAELEHIPWATGHRGTGLDAVLRNVCNRLGGFEPEIRHRSDDGLVLAAIVASGRAVSVALLSALLATSLPQITTRRLREERLQRTIFTAARATTRNAPAVVAVREALAVVAREIASHRHDVDALD